MPETESQINEELEQLMPALNRGWHPGMRVNVRLEIVAASARSLKVQLPRATGGRTAFVSKSQVRVNESTKWDVAKLIGMPVWLYREVRRELHGLPKED